MHTPRKDRRKETQYIVNKLACDINDETEAYRAWISIIIMAKYQTSKSAQNINNNNININQMNNENNINELAYAQNRIFAKHQAPAHRESAEGGNA